MKFRVTMKDPDSLTDAIYNAVQREVEAVPGITADERRTLTQSRRDDAMSAASTKWFKYGEYVTIEIDTEAQTAIVCPTR